MGGLCKGIHWPTVNKMDRWTMPNMEAAPLHRSLFTPLREHYGEAGQFGDKRDGRRYLSPNLATASFSAMPPTFLVLRVNEPNRGSGRVCPRAAANPRMGIGKAAEGTSLKGPKMALERQILLTYPKATKKL